ncbi:disks large-associated protein 5-like isoform X2 [Eriocheir sinensis]|nr:disks large-associated protein 5-like isoform X2 [Eriocheir sinensis]XP_050691137.1 disks large-associated protein 5-like isoform X2 [Eriocheir sinensis]XP_050691138.1 disks large-associated protein 5-like isoform X2 [Eriocheir sinensis]
MVNMSVAGFRDSVKRESNNFLSLCQYFRGVLKTTPDLTEDIIGDITVAIGQAELLMKERFVQFSDLIDDCELNRGEKEVTCQDLQGFWDIVYIQVEDVVNKFNQLKKLQKNGWEVTKPSAPPPQQRQPLVKKVENKKIGPSKPSRGNSDLRAMIQAARQKAREEKSNANGDAKQSQFSVCLEVLSSHKEAPEERKEVEIAAFRTPIKTKTFARKHHTPGRSEVRVLASPMLKEQLHMSPVIHKDYSPCMRVTRSMKARANLRKLDLNL